jgi:hypothetical protein
MLFSLQRVVEFAIRCVDVGRSADLLMPTFGKRWRHVIVNTRCSWSAMSWDCRDSQRDRVSESLRRAAGFAAPDPDRRIAPVAA